MMQTAASVQERAAMLHQKQLFEKFWKGTFKAVAMPRPESVIAASITARSRLTRPEAEADETPGDRRTDSAAAESKLRDVADRARKKHTAADHFVAPTDWKKGHRHRRHHRHLRHRLRHHRARSTSFGEDLSLQPKGKKKKKKKKKKKTKSKSERKRLTSRSPSCSPSPLRKKRKKKMKKKKKSSKKSKRHRYTSKKSKHSGSSRFKRSPKDGRKRKRSSRSGWRGKRRRGSSASYRPSSSAEDRPSASKKQCSPTSEAKWTNGGSVSKSVKTASVLSAACTFLSKPSRGRASGQDERSHDCDSGNDTSSPPSCETGAADKSEARRRASPSPAKLPFADRDDDVSDSGNSVTSFASLCKVGGEDGLSAALLKREHEPLGCRFDTVRSPRMSSRGRSSPEWHRRRRRSMSSRSSRYSERRFPSSSLSSASSYSRSPSYSLDLRQRRGSLSSVSSRGSYFRHRRSRSRTRASSSRETDGDRKISRKRRRRKSYSPVRKRRRDSPSHLEARRITSARKRPVPYLRRSPSSCSSLSAPSPRSLFHLCRHSVSVSSSSSSSSSSSLACKSNSRSSSWSFEARQRSTSRY